MKNATAYCVALGFLFAMSTMKASAQPVDAVQAADVVQAVEAVEAVQAVEAQVLIDDVEVFVAPAPGIGAPAQMQAAERTEEELPDEEAGSEESQTHAKTATVYLQNGDFLSGRLALTDTAEQLGWNSRHFADPLMFDVQGIQQIKFVSPARAQAVRQRQVQEPQPVGLFQGGVQMIRGIFGVKNSTRRAPQPRVTRSVETKNLGARIQLANGSILFGNIAGCDEQWISVQSDRHGEIRIRRDQISTIEGVSDKSSLLISELGNLNEWTVVGKNGDWRQQGRAFETKVEGATISRDTRHDGSILIDLVLSSTGKLRYQIFVAAAANPNSLASAFAIETWNNKLVAHRQVANEFAQQVLLETLPDAKNLNLSLHLDAESHRLNVFVDGNQVGSFENTDAPGKGGSHVFIQNRGTDLTVDQFRVRKWLGGIVKLEWQSAQDQIVLSDATVLKGKVTAWSESDLTIRVEGEEDAEEEEKEEERQLTVELANVDRILLGAVQSNLDDKPEEKYVRIEYADSGTVIARYQGIAQDGVLLASDAIDGNFVAKWDGLERMEFHLGTTQAAAEKRGLLEHSGVRLHGRVTRANRSGNVRWEPVYCSQSVPVVLGGNASVSFEPTDTAQYTDRLTDRISLTNGDTVPCLLRRIDADSIFVELADGQEVQIDRTLLKAIQRNPTELQLYSGFRAGDAWMSTQQMSKDSYQFQNGSLQFFGNANVAKEVGLPDQCKIAFDAHWSQDGAISIAVGADNAKNALNVLGNRGITQEMMQDAAKEPPDYVVNITVVRQGKSLSANAIVNAAGILGQMMGGRYIQNARRSTLALGENASAHIEFLVDRINKEYSLVANGRELIGWRESTPIEGGFLKLGVSRQATHRNQVFYEGVPQSTSPSDGEIVRLFNLQVSQWPGVIPEDELNRLLTRRLGALPNATSHVIRAFNGDSLRGQLVRIENDHVIFKARLDTFTIPLEKVCQIISLDEISGSQASDPEVLQIRLHGGGSATLVPTEVDADFITGDSAAIGKLSIPWQIIAALEFGGRRSQPDATWSAWTLREPPALPEPASGSPTENPGASSPLVGKPAPSMDWKMLNGESMSLADLQGKVVILDFWATWCGPCVGSLPTMMKVAEERHKSVVLIAVNQQETSDDIQGFLASRSWQLDVALDPDGTFGRRYGVQGIPHTVIIDPQGTVVDVHVGATPDLETHLNEVLDKALGKPSES